MKNEQNIQSLKRQNIKLKYRAIYYLLIIICLLFIFSIKYIIKIDSSDEVQVSTYLEIASGVLSSSIIGLVYSYISGATALDTKENSDFTDYSNFISLLDSISLDLKTNFNDEIELFRGTGDSGNPRRLNYLIENATNRLWILGADLSRTMSSHKESILKRANQGNFDIRIITCHPNSLFMFTRYYEIPGMTFQRMVQSTREANQTIKHLENKITNETTTFEKRFSFVQPTVQIMVIDDFLVLSHFLDKHSSSQSVRILYKPFQNEGNGFIEHFQNSWIQGFDYKDNDLIINQTEKQEESMLSQSAPKDSSENLSLSEYSVIRKHSIYRTFFVNLLNRATNLLAYLWRGVQSILAPLIIIGFAIIGYMLLPSDSFAKMQYFLLGSPAAPVIEVIAFIVYNQISKREPKNYDEQLALLQDSLDSIFCNQRNHCGIEAYPNRTDVRIEDQILKAKKRVWIYATNFSFIEENNSGAFDYLQKETNLDVRLLMLDPNSLFVDTRWGFVLKNSADDFANEICASLNDMYSHFKKYNHIRMKLYSRQPNFMLYLIDDTLIVSPILIQGQARNQPHFCFNLRYPSVSKYANDYIEHFKSIWDESKKVTVRRIKYKKTLSGRKLLTFEKGVQIKLKSVPLGPINLKQPEAPAVFQEMADTTTVSKQ